MRINLNDSVRVRLTNFGRNCVLKNALELARTAPPAAARIIIDGANVDEDGDGWSTWQLWRLMEEFGPHIRMGAEVPFETTLEIPNPLLPSPPVSPPEAQQETQG